MATYECAKCFNDQFLPIARANYRQSAIKSSNNDLSLSLTLSLDH